MCAFPPPRFNKNYEILGLTSEATNAEVKRAYRKLAKTLHPDRCREDGCHERFVTLAAAYKNIVGDDDLYVDPEYGAESARPMSRSGKNSGPTPRRGVGSVGYVTVAMGAIGLLALCRGRRNDPDAARAAIEAASAEARAMRKQVRRLSLLVFFQPCALASVTFPSLGESAVVAIGSLISSPPLPFPFPFRVVCGQQMYNAVQAQVAAAREFQRMVEEERAEAAGQGVSGGGVGGDGDETELESGMDRMGDVAAPASLEELETLVEEMRQYARVARDKAAAAAAAAGPAADEDEDPSINGEQSL